MRRGGQKGSEALQTAAITSLNSGRPGARMIAAAERHGDPLADLIEPLGAAEEDLSGELTPRRLDGNGGVDEADVLVVACGRGTKVMHQGGRPRISPGYSLPTVMFPLLSTSVMRQPPLLIVPTSAFSLLCVTRMGISVLMEPKLVRASTL